MATRRVPWWTAYIVTILILAVLDLALRAWMPNDGTRLPEAFSAGYLKRIVDENRGRRDVLLVLGDSVLWGYKVRDDETALSILRHEAMRYHILDLSYEGGSPANSELLWRYVVSQGVHPQLVLTNVNQKQFNPLDPAFRTIRPSVAYAARDVVLPEDRKALDLAEDDGINARLGRAVEAAWYLYRYRVDLREMLIGREDFATLLADAAHAMTGYAAREGATKRPTADKFLGTYDLTPLDRNNLSFERLDRFAKEVHGSGARLIAFLTPTNHALLHDYIDSPDYQNNLKATLNILRRDSARTLDLDAAFPQRDFIDNDHLDAVGHRRLAAALATVLLSAR